ncbi:MAG TPA: AAA family ATPase [Acidimicrobiales bacterium]|nr:AAA family ATPase [Acidimicrobiales bacterium]
MLCPVTVGREAETELLAGGLTAARSGRGGAVLVLGEAGIGKSRFTWDARAMAARAGMATLTGRAVQGTVPVPFRPLAEAVQGAFRRDPPPDSPDLAPFRAVLARLAPQFGRPADASEVTHLVLSEAVTRLVGALGRSRGCLLVLEDLHWADMETLAVVEYLADHLGTEPVLCVGTVRTGEASEAERLAVRLVERRAATVVALEQLDLDEIDRIAAACLGDEELPPALRDFLRSRSEGVPFLVEELLAGLVGAGALLPGAHGWRVVSRLVPTVPMTFAETVRRRLGGLDDSAQVVVQAAAVLGRRFDCSLLPAMTGLSDNDVAHGLQAGLATQLVARDPDSDGFRFRHALSRDVVFADLLPPDGTRLAARAGAAVEAAHPGLPGEWCELAADLAERAGDRQRAGELLLEAARRAVARGAPASAQATLARAAGLEELTGSLPLDIAEATAQAAALAGDVDRATGLAGAILGALDDGAKPGGRKARLHLVLGRAAVTSGRWDVARRHVEEAAALAGEQDAALTAVAGALAAQVAVAEGRLGDALALAGQVMAEGEASSPPEAVCEALEVLGRVARLHDLGEAEAHFAAAQRVAERHGLAMWRARALHELGTIDLFTTLRHDRLKAARQAAVDAGAVGIVALADLHLASVALASWDIEAAVAAAERCVDVSRRLGLSTLGMGLVHLACGYASAGREREMGQALEQAGAVAGDAVDVAAGIVGRAPIHLAFRRGDFTAALGAMDDAMLILRRDPSVFFPFTGMWALLRTVEDDRGAAARAEAAQAVGASVVFNRAYLRMAEAVDAGGTGRRDEARRAFGEARDEVRYAPAWEVWWAIIQRIVAVPALQDGWGDPVTWLRESLAVFQDHELEELASSCRTALRAAGEKVPRRGRGETDVPGPLRAAGITSREVDVLRLVAENLSNREIATRLYLSHRTVDRHVSNLLAKAGAANRRELAGLAARAGLGSHDGPLGG